MLDLAHNLRVNAKGELYADQSGLQHNGQPLSQIFFNRSKRLRKSNMFKTQSNLQKLMQLDVQPGGVQYASVAAHLR